MSPITSHITPLPFPGLPWNPPLSLLTIDVLVALLLLFRLLLVI